MKTLNRITLTLSVFALLILINACQKEDSPLVNDQNDNSLMSAERRAKPLVLSPCEKHYGKTYGEWGEEWWKWTLGFDCATSPHASSTGSLQDQDQKGPVYFLAGAFFNSPAHRSAHISSHKAIFFSLLARLQDDTTGLKASGESLKGFLTEGAMSAVDGVDILSATLDGVNILNLKDYRAHSGLFTYKGNTAGCVLPVTGLPTKAVTDGYWLLLNPLSEGTHILHFTGGISGPGLLKDVTDTLIVN